MPISIPPCPHCGAKLIDARVSDSRAASYLCTGPETHRIGAEDLKAAASPEDIPLISCLMPTKNRRRFIADSIRMFQAQTYPNKELIIIADGDDIEDLLPAGHGVSQFAELESGQVVNDGSILHARFDGTLGAKLNFGARLAGGDNPPADSWLCNWDDDDWQHPARLTLQLMHAQMTGKAVMGLSSGCFWTEGEPVAHEYHGTLGYALGTSLFYRRDWAIEHPHADDTEAEDVSFSAAAHAAGQLSTMSGLDVIVARDHESNTSKRSRGRIRFGDVLLKSDNWREVPLERITHIVGAAKVPA